VWTPVARKPACNPVPSGAGFARSLIAKGLVDQYALVIHPIALGTGLPIFSDLTAPRKLKIVNSTSFPSGVIARVCRAA